MGKIISFANQKGGVGKTTSAVNVAASLGLLRKKVLMVDLDPQGNATSGLGIAKKDLSLTVRDLFTLQEEGCSPERLAEVTKQTIVQTEYANLSLIPATIALSGSEFELFSYEDSAYYLKTALDLIRGDYEYIIVDCPPSLGMLTLEAMAACDGLIVPMQCEFYSLEGLSQLMITVSKIRQKYNASLAVTGIILTMYNSRLVLTNQVVGELRAHYGDKLFGTPVSRSVRASEAPSYGMPVYYLDRHSKIASEYMDIARELIGRV
ncbi:MAG: ParA family protein [Clostridia bacterium]|nr:ParA family protein [Clostridia bacterium]MBP5173629.1 ParA family protein [Clostridia bacterium]